MSRALLPIDPVDPRIVMRFITAFLPHIYPS
jgi:hypothetical protein